MQKGTFCWRALAPAPAVFSPPLQRTPLRAAFGYSEPAQIGDEVRIQARE
jgi:hypothetical protein